MYVSENAYGNWLTHGSQIESDTAIARPWLTNPDPRPSSEPSKQAHKQLPDFHQGSDQQDHCVGHPWGCPPHVLKVQERPA